MAATIIVNNLTVVHKSSGGTSIAAPDVCKTPTPGGPAPIPYANAALSRHTAGGSKQVRGDKHPLMLKPSSFSTSAGDEPGTLGGVASSKTKGKASPRSFSSNVKIEGEPVFRNTDIMAQNAGSAGNSVGLEGQPNKVAAAMNADKAEVVEMRWSKTKLCCGDRVNIAVTTRSADNGQLVQVWTTRTDPSRCTTMDGIPVEVQGNKADKSWISRWRFIFKEKIPAVAEQRVLQGAQKSSNALEFHNPPDVPRVTITPPPIRTPKHILDEVQNRWVRNGELYGGDACFELELSKGWVILRRKLDFNLRSGQGPVHLLTWRDWKQEIESIWDRKFYFHRTGCKRGQDCDCILMGCCKYPLRIFAVPGAGHGKVDLFDGGPKKENWGERDLWWYSHTWWSEIGDAPMDVRAHEFGHLIGCFDEYAAGACHPSRAWVDAPNSIMNDGKMVFPRHVEAFRDWFAQQAGAVVGDVDIVRI